MGVERVGGGLLLGELLRHRLETRVDLEVDGEDILRALPLPLSAGTTIIAGTAGRMKPSPDGSAMVVVRTVLYSKLRRAMVALPLPLTNHAQCARQPLE